MNIRVLFVMVKVRRYFGEGNCEGETGLLLVMMIVRVMVRMRQC